MTVRLVALLVTGILCALPAAASAQQDPFGPIPQAPPDQQVQTVAQAPAQQQDSGGSISNTQLLLIAIAGFVLLAGIAWAIVRDARRTAPVGAHDLQDPAKRHKGTRPPPDKQVARNRAKARAARRARKKSKHR